MIWSCIGFTELQNSKTLQIYISAFKWHCHLLDHHIIHHLSVAHPLLSASFALCQVSDPSGACTQWRFPPKRIEKSFFAIQSTFSVTIVFALPATNREIKRKENSSDFGVRTTRGKTNSQLAWLAGKELVTIPRYRICYNWKQYRTQAWTSTV